MMMISGQLQAYVTRVCTNQTFYYSNKNIDNQDLASCISYIKIHFGEFRISSRICSIFLNVIIHLKTWHDMLRIVCHSLYCEFCLDIIFFYVTCRNKVTKSNTVS